MNSPKNFQCKICKDVKPIGEIIKIEDQICCTCFQSIQIHKRVMKQITFFKKTLQEKKELTPLRLKKIHELIKLNDLFAFGLPREDKTEGRNGRADILKTSTEELGWFIEDYYAKASQLPRLRYRKKKYYLKYYPADHFDFDKLKKIINSYQNRVVETNLQKNKFKRFVYIIGKQSQFSTLKDRLRNALNDFIQREKSEEFEELKRFIFEGAAQIYKREPDILPNISLFFYQHYDYIFSKLLTEIFPFDKLKISFDDAAVNSRTDFGLKLFYRYNTIEMHAIQSVIDSEKLEKAKMENVCKFLFINSIKTITTILDELFQYYYRKLHISSPVRSIVNTPGGSKQKSTKRYNEVTFWIAMREW